MTAECGHKLKTHAGASCTRPGNPEYGGRCGQHRALTAIERAKIKEARQEKFADHEFHMDLKEAQRELLAALILDGLSLEDSLKVRQAYEKYVKLLNIAPKYKWSEAQAAHSEAQAAHDSLSSFSELGQGPMAERK